MDRNPISDLEAVAAMPGLEELAQVIVEHDNRRRGGDLSEAMGTLVFLAGRHAFGSANVCDSVMQATSLWDQIRASAAKVGRQLPEQPPTFSKLHHLRVRADEGMASALAERLADVAVPLAQSIGLLDPTRPSPWHRPDPTRVIYGDGSVFAALSGVTEQDGVVQGSRAVARPRVAEQFVGKSGLSGGTGIPISVVGVHGRHRWMRVVLGVAMYRDGNEIGTSMSLFERIIALSQGGVSHVTYDGLMQGRHLRELMKQGVVPVVSMPEASKDAPHLVLPAELQRHGYRSEGGREKRKGKGSRRRSRDDVAAKSRIQVHHVAFLEHDTPWGTCGHDLYAVDGSLVSVPAGGAVTLSAEHVECLDVVWEVLPDGEHPIGTFEVPCPQGRLRYEFDFASDAPGRATNGQRPAWAHRVRMIPETATGHFRTTGLRSDAESIFSTFKAVLPRHRACSLDPVHFLLDVVGASLLTNAVAWDVHGAQHTLCARDERLRETRRALRSVA